MKATSKFSPSRAGGYGTLPVIAMIALMLITSLVFVMRRGIVNQETQAKVQLRADYRQREDSLARALLAIVPNKAIGCMQEHSASNHQSFLWDTIFDEAIAFSNSSEQLSPAMVAALGLSGARNSNSADKDLTSSQLFLPIVTGAGSMLPGNTRSANMLSGEVVAAKLPPMLGGANNMLVKDARYPIISRSKVLESDDSTGQYQLKAADYPLYNLVRFPDIRFGFASPGDYVVGKRNWWAFSVEYGNGTGLGTVRKNYVLSIYELPNQLPISASAETTVGSYADGTNWGAGVNVAGSVFADRLNTEGVFNFDRLLGRQGVSLGTSTTLNGESLPGNFDALGVREALAANRNSHILPVAVASNAGKIAFISLKRGEEFYTEASSATVNAISDTSWDDYTRGANQCAMKVYVTKMKDINSQEPLEIEIHYLKPSGSSHIKKLKRYATKQSPKPNDYWPEEKVGWESEGGNLIPFQTEEDNGSTRPSLTIYPARMGAWLQSIGATAETINNSIYVTTRPASDPITVRGISIPSIAGDPAVILRDCSDLSAFTRGFALVSNMRCYLAGDVNQQSIPAPSGAGLPPGELYYPPFAIFTPEYRIGTGASATAVNFKGQVGSVGNSEGESFRPLDFKSGSSDAVTASKISAELESLKSPAELPPIFNMNWLLTVEEIHP